MKLKYKFCVLLFSSALTLGVLNLHVVRKDIPILAEDEKVIVYLNDKVTVESRRLVHDTDYKVVDGTIITPSGATFVGREFTIKEHGAYKVVYEAYFGHYKVSKTVTYFSQRRSTDYFTVNDAASISYGDFRYNTTKYSHQGVIIDFKNGATINFNEPLNMDDFMEAQQIEPGKEFKDPCSLGATAKTLIDLIVDPTTQMEMDYKGILIKLIDTEDSNNYVELRMEDPGYSDYLAGALSYIRAGYSGGFLAGWEYGWAGSDGVYHEGHYHLTSSGTGIAASFKGQPYQDILHSGQILFDYGNKRFYTYPGSLSHTQTFFINDLDNLELYRSGGWKGFTNNKCYLSITPYNFNNTKGRLVIKSIGKYDFSKEEMIDEVAPTINIDYLGHNRANLPKAVVGEYYPIFKAQVNDNYDQNSTPKVSVIYKDTVNNKDIDVDIKDEKFLAKKEGTYYIRYDASDRSGNVSDTISLRVTTTNSVDDVVLSSDISSLNATVFDEVDIPDVSEINSSGGSGNIAIERHVYDPNNNEVSIENNNFKPDLIGNYVIEYIGKDYLSNSGSLTINLDVKGLDKPIFVENINLPPLLIEGFSYEINQVKTMESVNGENIEGISAIFVNDVSSKGAFVASGESVKIEYVASGSSGETSLIYNLPVIKPNNDDETLNQANYFYGDVSKTVNNDDITLSFDSEASLVFANKLDSSDFLLAFEKVDNKTKFSNIEVKLVDVLDPTNSLTFNINVKENYASMPGLEKMNFLTSDKEIIIQYKDETRSLLDTFDNTAGTCLYNDSGKEFNGFKNGVYLSFRFLNVTGNTEIKLIKLNNHPLGYKESGVDSIRPSIRLDDEFVGEQFFNQEFYYPTFTAYDVFNEIESSTIKIIKPNDDVVTGDAKMRDSFKIDQFGSYIVTYQAKDKAGNQARITYVAFVYDNVKPILDVDELTKVNYRVGDVFSIPGYHASDNLGYVTVDVLLRMPDNELRILTHDENGEVTYALIDNNLYNNSFIVNKTSFKLETKGRYTLRYVAYDQEFNSTVVEYVFNVD